MKKRKIAIVHDDFIQNGGAEFFIFEIAKKLSQVDDFEIEIFSSIITEDWKRKFSKEGLIINESFLGKVPLIRYFSKLLFLTPLFYISFETFDFSNFDFVLSSSTRYGQNVITKPETIHISYVNSPGKMMWETSKYFYGKKFTYFFIKNFLPKSRTYDYYSQNRADFILANSKNISSKIDKNYNLKSHVIYPFVDFKQIHKNNYQKQDYYILISRLVPWKRLDFVIETFNELGAPLIIVGAGDETYTNYLKKMSKSNITFTGFIDNSSKYKLLEEARALIFPQDEDFGLTLLESLYLNTPVIYFNRGGAREVMNSSVGVAFDSQNKDDLISAVNKFEQGSFAGFNSRAQEFSEEVFFDNLSNFLKQPSNIVK